MNGLLSWGPFGFLLVVAGVYAWLMYDLMQHRAKLKADRQELVDAYAEWRRLQQATMIQTVYMDVVETDGQWTRRIREGMPFGRN